MPPAKVIEVDAKLDSEPLAALRSLDEILTVRENWLEGSGTDQRMRFFAHPTILS